MTHIEETIKRVKSVLNSGLTPYRIAKEVGYAGANPVHDLISGKSDINRMQLGTALKFEKLYEELEKMNNIKDVIEQYEKGNLELDLDYDFHEVEFIDGVSDRYIVHNVVGTDFKLAFAEREEVENLRAKIEYAESEEEKWKLENSMQTDYGNDLEDMFDYDTVAGYDKGSGVELF